MTTSSPQEYRDPVDRVQAYRLGLEAMRDAKVDAGRMAGDPLYLGVAEQLVRAAGSISANIAEGYSRGTVRDRKKYLEYALGSTRECVVWYQTSDLPQIAPQLARLTSIRRLLLTMIKTTRESMKADAQKFER